MNDVRRRLEVVGRILAGALNTGFVLTNAELLALQLRKIAECIALASICSHREEYQKLRAHFEKDWNAKPILRMIEKINPHYYPRPCREIPDPKTGKVQRVELARDGYLTCDELVALIDKCSEVLHQFNPYQPALPDMRAFIAKCSTWRAAIRALLDQHQVQLVDSDRIWWIVINHGEDGFVNVFEVARVHDLA